MKLFETCHCFIRMRYDYLRVNTFVVCQEICLFFWVHVPKSQCLSLSFPILFLLSFPNHTKHLINVWKAVTEFSNLIFLPIRQIPQIPNKRIQ